MQPDSYETLKNWYLAKLRKSALETAGEMTPSALLAADRNAIEKMISDRAESNETNRHGVKFAMGSLALVELEAMNKSFSQMQGRISELEERESAIADYALDLILSIDKAGLVIAINPAIQVQTGHAPASLIGKTLSNIIAPANRSKLARTLEEAGRTASVKEELQISTLSGNLKDYRWTFEWSESNKSFFCTARDISAEKQLARVKQEFIAMVSHDLRAPLMSIQLSLGLISKYAIEQIPQQYREQIHSAERSTESLISLINDLLDLEKMEAGRLQIRLEEVMIQDIFERAIVILRELAASKSIALEFEASELEFKADGARLEQVLVNLISNAIKFSPENSSIRLRAELQGRMIEVCVIDEGRGIPEEHRAQVFDRFQQVQDKDSKRGSGLGLAICKLIVESHSGSIGVRTPENGKGSEFWFKLPFRK